MAESCSNYGEEIISPPAEEVCIICLDNITQGRGFIYGCRCSHRHPFCYSCIKAWLKVKAVCPICGRLVNLDSIRRTDSQADGALVSAKDSFAQIPSATCADNYNSSAHNISGHTVRDVPGSDSLDSDQYRESDNTDDDEVEAVVEDNLLDYISDLRVELENFNLVHDGNEPEYSESEIEISDEDQEQEYSSSTNENESEDNEVEYYHSSEIPLELNNESEISYYDEDEDQVSYESGGESIEMEDEYYDEGQQYPNSEEESSEDEENSDNESNQCDEEYYDEDEEESTNDEEFTNSESESYESGGESFEIEGEYHDEGQEYPNSEEESGEDEENSDNDEDEEEPTNDEEFTNSESEYYEENVVEDYDNVYYSGSDYTDNEPEYSYDESSNSD